jgi:hypothetical protein
MTPALLFFKLINEIISRYPDGGHPGFKPYTNKNINIHKKKKN